MTRSDLEDLKEFDGAAIRFGGFGSFLASGSFWLAAEKSLEDWESFRSAPIALFLLLAFSVGLFLIWQGLAMHRRKSSRIDRIFSETRDQASATPKLEAEAAQQSLEEFQSKGGKTMEQIKQELGMT